MKSRRKSPQNEQKRKMAAERVKAQKEEQALRLQTLTLKAGYRKQIDLARDSGVHWQTLGSYWNGERRLSSNPRNAALLAAALNKRLPKDKHTTSDYLMFGTSPAHNVTKLSHTPADAGNSRAINLFSTIEIAYLLKLARGEDFEWQRMTTVENPDLFFGGAMIPKRLTGVIHGDAISLIDPDAPSHAGDLVLAVIPALNDSVIAELRQERQSDGSFRTILERPSGPIALHPEAGDVIVGPVWGDFVRRKRG